MKHEVEKIIGKRIVGVVMKETKKEFQPSSQLFLLFDDHTSYEFYSDDGYINSTGSIGTLSLDEILHETDDRTRVALQASLPDVSM